MKRTFLDLGQQPIANAFKDPNDKSDEFKFHLTAQYDDETHLVSLGTFVDKSKLFHKDYKYSTSANPVMVEHFRKVAEDFVEEEFVVEDSKVLEIGSNDGAFLKNFKPENAIAVEPCANFAEITNKQGYRTYNKFWNKETASEILENHGKFDTIFAANCFCHIPEIEEAFEAISMVLEDEGTFVFEDPSLLSMIKLCSYDQIYDEHAHMFSALSIQKLVEKFDLVLWDVEEIPVHGNSNRYYIGKKRNCYPLERVEETIDKEKVFGLDKWETYETFEQRVQNNKQGLIERLQEYKNAGCRIIGYGATSKSTVVYNFCGINKDLIECVSDTTPSKFGLLMPGTDIPIKSYEEVFKESVDVAYLGAWNYEKDIIEKETPRMLQGMKILTHVPTPNTIVMISTGK